MNKRFFILFFVISGIYTINAQVTFKPGFRAGANFTHFTKEDYYNDLEYSDPVYDNNYSSKTSFYAGFSGTIQFSKLYALQPEINYSSQGSDYKSALTDRTFKVDYLCFQAINKFTFADRFNLHFGPTFEFVVDQNFNTEVGIDMAFVLGAGVNLTRNFGLEFRAKKGIIPVIDFNDSTHTNVVFSVGGTYTFDVK